MPSDTPRPAKRLTRSARVYRAELDLGFLGFFTSSEDAQAYVDRIVRSRWWKKRGEIVEVFVVYGRFHTYCFADKLGKKRGIISINRAHLCESYILHELAHLLRWPRGEEDHHSPGFLQVELDLIAKWAGPYHAEKLRTYLIGWDVGP